MKTLYAFDENKYPTGQTREVEDRAPTPPGWTDQQPPENDGVRFVGGQWESAPTRSEWLNRPQEVNKRRQQMAREANAEYQRVLAEGFTDADGVSWPVNEQARSRVLDLTQHIQEFRAGKVANELPGGRSSVTLRDASNTPRQASADKIVALAEQGAEFKEDAQDNLESLLASIEAATSQSDLDAIDVTDGWLN